jgi:hypothetical protein
MAAPKSMIEQSYKDYSKETSHLRLWVTTLTAGNFAAQTALHLTLFGALDAITLGLQQKTRTIADVTVLNTTPATNPLAQRENKWLLRYHGNTTRKNFTAELPCADLTKLDTNNTDFIDKGSTEWTDLKAAFEAVVVDPDDGSAVTLDDAEFVGRNL